MFRAKPVVKKLLGPFFYVEMVEVLSQICTVPIVFFFLLQLKDGIQGKKRRKASSDKNYWIPFRLL
jgi:hypothetical protein